MRLVFVGAMLGVLMTGTTSDAANRQTGLRCVKEYYGITDNTPANADMKEVNFAPSLATQLLEDIVSRSNLDLKPVAIPCDQVENASPFEPESGDGLPSELGQKKFIVYQKLWVREVLGKSRDMAVFLLGHELGHIIRQHFRRDLDDLTMESEADSEGGCVLARMGGAWPPVEDLLSRLRPDVDSNYPSAKKSIRLARTSYEDCGEGRKSDTPNLKTEVLYFYKRADEGKVVSVLNRLAPNFQVRQSGVFQGVDFSDRQTDTITCHDGSSLDLVKELALAMFDEGVPLKAISKPDADIKRFKNRVTIEAAAKGRPQLSRREIELLDQCPDQSDPVFGKGR
jgi:hypothetical protein